MTDKMAFVYGLLFIYSISAIQSLVWGLYFIGRTTNQKSTKKKSTELSFTNQENPKRSYTNQKTRDVLSSVKNNVHVTNKATSARNDVSEYQKIKTSEVTLPVIAATVLSYPGGELGEAFPEPTDLYYSPEALDDKEFLESVLRSPWNTKTHELNTNEDNLKVSGWANQAWYDKSDKTVYAKGFLIGEENIDYAKDNQDQKGFGTSAFISFLKIDKEEGVTPEGLKYNAVARKAVCNHVAILPNIRDEKNKIVSINAKNATIVNNNATKNKLNGVKNMEQSEFNSLMDKYQEEKNSKNEETDKIVNAVMAKMAKNEEEKKASEEKKPEAPNDDKTVDEKKVEPEKTNSKNEEEKKEELVKNEDGKTDAANAMPSEKIIGIFSEHLGVGFKKTPTIKELAELAEIPFTGLAQTLNALRKKSEELSGSSSSAKNTDSETKSFSESLKEF